MAKVDWINWKTDTNEIIKPLKSTERITNLINDCDKYINNIIYESIIHEMKSGGLDRESLNIVGVSPAYERADRIIDITNNIRESLNDLQNNIFTSTQKQKEIEKQQLIEAIQKKIEEETKILETTNILKEKLQTGSNVVNIQEVLNIISLTEEKIKRLHQRLERTKTI